MNRTIAASLAAAVSWSFPVGGVLADALEDGTVAFERMDFSAAFTILEPLAKQGHADAQSMLAQMYRNGWGVAQSTSESAKWYGMAAEGGNAHAQWFYGHLLQDGDGVPKDVVATAKWYRRSADQGYPPAMASLAKAYSFGMGLPRDYVEAFVWYSLAVDRMPAGQRQQDAVHSRDSMASRLSPEELAAAMERIKAWRPK